jgi:hypothetical protein
MAGKLLFMLGMCCSVPCLFDCVALLISFLCGHAIHKLPASIVLLWLSLFALLGMGGTLFNEHVCV